jgi:hypothetical protein
MLTTTKFFHELDELRANYWQEARNRAK